MLMTSLVLAGGLSAVLGVAWVGLYWRFLRVRKLWRSKRVAYKEPRFLSGNFAEAGTKNLGVIFRELYEEGKSGKVLGVWQFNVPVLLIIDLELVKRVLVADFSHFDDHGVYFDEDTDPLAVNLLTMGGSAWRSLRTKLNPAFTAGKLRGMFPIVVECGEELRKVLRSSAEGQEVVEFKDLLARYTTDVISRCAFGIEANSLKHEKAIFRTMGKKVFQPSWEVLCRNFVGFLFPDFAKFFKVRIYPKHLTDFFVGIVRETMNYRETNNIKRNDILQMLIQLKNEGFMAEAESGKEERKIWSRRDGAEGFGYEQAAAQAFIFFTAGFETSSTTMQYALYELASHPDIQNRAREEMLRTVADAGGCLTYDALQRMTYLGRVVDETLRKYPPATNLSRVCTKKYRVPGMDLVLEEGTQVSVSVLGLHWDDRYYPRPHVFDPDRFTEEQKTARPPYTYMPFGEGPRTCIGQRFGMTQVKVGLVSILLNYQVSLSETKTQIPPVYDPKSFFSAPKGGMHLKISLLEAARDLPRQTPRFKLDKSQRCAKFKAKQTPVVDLKPRPQQLFSS